MIDIDTFAANSLSHWSRMNEAHDQARAFLTVNGLEKAHVIGMGMERPSDSWREFDITGADSGEVLGTVKVENLDGEYVWSATVWEPRDGYHRGVSIHTNPYVCVLAIVREAVNPVQS